MAYIKGSIVGWVKQGVTHLHYYKKRSDDGLRFTSPILLLLSLILNPGSAHALKAPHASPNITLCSDCHSRTGAGFATITSQNVLCINAIGCHNPGGRAKNKALSLLDASNRFGNLPAQSGARQSSHGWKIPNLNSDAGVTKTDKWGELGRGPQGTALNNKLLCTRCHRAHGEKAGYTIYDKFLRENPKGNYICFQCHAARQINNVRDPKPADKHYSHPVEVNYSTIQASKPDFFEKTPLNPYQSNPSAAMKLYTSYNNQKGNVVCQTCHGPLHSADSNPYTFDNLTTYSKSGNYSTSEGNLLRRYPAKKSNDLCASCHKVTAHRNFLCSRCHAPHKKAGEENRYLIHENISTPNSGKRAVQFVSTSQMARRYGNNSQAICQVCHTNTFYHRNYSTSGVKRDHNYLGGNSYKFCPNCHRHTQGFSPESGGNVPCVNCHSDLFDPMNATGNGYHHYLNNGNVTNLASGSKYPVINPPAPLGGTSDQNRRCLQCHVEHDIFKPELNWQSPGRAYNLRYDISTLPNRTTAGINSDYVPSSSPNAAKAPNGGICLSCHQNSQTKSYAQPDGTTKTPVINRTLFDASPHQYEADSTFNSGATVFKANCSKCHIDTLNKTKQGAGASQVGPHYSNVRRIQAGSSNTNNTGTATSGTTSTVLEDTAKSWGIDIWSGFTINILEGTGAGQSRTITGNAANSVTVSPAFSPAPASGSKYLIHYSREFESGTSSGSNGATTLNDTTKAWMVNYWKNRPVTIIKGTGYGQTRRISSNTTTQLTVDAAWTTIPDNTSQYSIGDPMEEELCFKCHSRQSNPYASENKDYYGTKTFDNSKALKMEELFNNPNKPFKHRIDNYFAKHRADESVNAPANGTSTGWLGDTTVSGGLHTGCADCHNPHGNKKPGEDNGVATSGTSTTLTQTGKSWTADQWRGYTLRLMDGAGRGQDRMITKNTADTLTVAAMFTANPGSGTYYIITPIGLADKGNNLWNPNSGTWGVTVNYTTPPVGSMASPTFTKKEILTGGEDKIYSLCFKCHSDYGWGTSGTPFSIPDAVTGSWALGEGPSTNIAAEFNPNNLGHHPVVAKGANQPITAAGFVPETIAGPFTATGGSYNYITYANDWNPGKYNGLCVEITSGPGAGQASSITSHTSTGINGLDPGFPYSYPGSGSVFSIRKCNSYTTEWPKFTGGTISMTSGNPTVTISGLGSGVQGGIPSTVIPGWFIYAGSASPGLVTTSGWFQVTGIAAGASDSSTTTTTFTVTPTPQSSYSGAYALTAGLGNSFVPPYGPWSAIGCADCHDTDDARDPSGPHASARNWMVRTLEAQSFTWYNGTGNDPSQVITVGWPDGNDSGWGTVWIDNKHMCYNCHRADVYVRGGIPTGGAYVNMSQRYMGRVGHPAHPTAVGGSNIFGIWCMHCHSGGLGGIHGSNEGIGEGGGSFRGRRLLNGAVWRGHSRATTSSGVTCYYGGNYISSCSGVGGGSGATASYPYFSGGDMQLSAITSAAAMDSSGGHAGIQTGDTVVIRFNGETNATPVTSANIDTALPLSSSHTWGSIAGAVWSTTTYRNDTLTVTLNPGATVAVGDTITSSGTIKNVLNGAITGSVTLTGDFGYWLISATASDASGGGPGIQTGDRVTIRLNGATAGTPVTAVNVNSALPLSGGHSWGSIQSADWTTTTYANDTLTITLADTPTPSVSAGDTITLNGFLKDANNAGISDSIALGGTFTSVPTGAVLFYTFDEGTGTAVSDATNYRNNGTAYNGIVPGATWTTGKSGSGLWFDGTNDFVSVPDSGSLDLTTTGTIELWVKKYANFKENQSYLMKGSQGYRIYDYGASGQLAFAWGDGGAGKVTMIDQIITGGLWNHVVVTFNTTETRIYVNGKLNKTGSGVNMTANSDPLWLGRDSAHYYDFNGTMDNLVIYNRTLSELEVKERFSRVRSAVADDNSGGGMGRQSGDRITVRFNTATQGTAINTGNIDSALALSDGHTWGTITSAQWTTTSASSDTLTITLGSSATAGIGDTITLGSTIKDSNGKTLTGAVRVTGSFGAIPGLPDGATAYWKIDETAGVSVADSGPYANNGTAQNGTNLGGTGRFGKGAAFDAYNDYISIADSNSLDLVDEWSIELWLKKNSDRSYQAYFAKGTPLITDVGTTGKINFCMDAINGSICAVTPSAVSTGVWHHVAGTWDGSRMRLYLDGSLAASSAGYVFLWSPDATTVLLGAASSGYYMDGMLDEAVVYNRVLTADEIRNRYGASMKSAAAEDSSGGGYGVQANDRVVLTFDGATAGNAITSLNINSALQLPSSHTWTDGSGGIGSAIWSTSVYQNDTLTVTFSANTSAPTVAVGDTITLGSAIKDTSGRDITGSVTITGTTGVASGKVGYWRLDSSGTDEVYGNTASFVGSGSFQKGRLGNAARFGSSGYAADSPALDLTDRGSIEFWVRKASHVNGVYLSKGDPATSGAYHILDSATGQLKVRWGSTSDVLVTNEAIPLYDWTHVAVTYDGNIIKVYINGVLAKSSAWSATAATNALPLYFSHDSYVLDALLDEVAVYNSVLTDSDILNSFNKGRMTKAEASDASSGGAGVQAGDRVTVWFSRGTDAPAIDASNINTILTLSNGHSWGTIQGAAWSQTSVPNDTLTVTLGTGSTIWIGDMITISGDTIKDSLNRSIRDNIVISGTFGNTAGVPANAVAWWRFNEASGTTAYNSAATGMFDGTINGGATRVSGKSGNALSFDGSNDYVNVPHSTALNPVADQTIEFWMYLDVLPTLWRDVIQKGMGAPGTFYYIRTTDAGGLEIGLQNSAGHYYRIELTAAQIGFAAGSWHHIAFVVDDSALTAYLYVNGVQRGTSSVQTRLRYDGTSDITIGGYTWDGYFPGKMDEVVIYNRALTASEIQGRFAGGFRDARGYDLSFGGSGPQAGDRAVIRFNTATEGPEINAGNIAAALSLNNGHTWTDGSGQIGATSWSSEIYQNDTLTVNLTGNTSLPTVAGWDTITLGTVIKDYLGRTLSDSTVILGNFDLPSDAVGYWRFNESSGTTAADSSLNLNNGTVSGSGWTWGAGRTGNSVSFNGVSDAYVTYPSNSAFALSGSYAVEAWVKPTSWPANGDAAILFNSGTWFLYNFALYGDGRIGFSYHPSGQIAGRTTAMSNTSLKLNEWNHVAVTRNGGSGSTATFYINGIAAGTFTDSHYTAVNGTLYTGRAALGGDTYYFPGLIDELVIYSRSLTADEVTNRAGTRLASARADDASIGGHGIQAGDKMTLTFNGETNALAVNSGNIGSLFALSNGHGWGNIQGAAWSSSAYANDTLTVTLNADATVVLGDVITLDGSIKDRLLRGITGTKIMSGSFCPVPDGAVAWYKLDETSGSVIVDSTWNDNQGTLYGNATRAAGKEGTAVSFDGTDDYIEITGTDFSLVNAMSVEFWVNAGNQVNGKGLISGDAVKIQAWSGSGNEINPGVITDSGGFQGAGWIAGGDAFDGAWHHIALTWDGTSQKLYKDGVDAGSATGNGTLLSQNTLRIGKLIGLGNDYFTGLIDEVIVYNKTLSPTEVAIRAGTQAQTVPAAPVIVTPTALSSTSIRWSFTDNATNETGFRLHDPSNALKGSAGTPNLTYINESGLTPNTQYTRHVHAANSAGESAASVPASIYTLSLAPNATADRTAATWYTTPNFVFTNAAGFGAGAVAYYRYAWDQNATHAFSDTESQWTTGTLSRTASSGGSWYLHLKSYNSENAGSGTKSYGPFNYDQAAPSASALSPANGTNGVAVASNLTLTLSDGVSGVDWTIFSMTLSGNMGYSKTYTDLDTSVVSKTGTSASYSVTVNPAPDFGSGEVITVTVNASDMAGNAMTPPVWSFTAANVPLAPAIGTATGLTSTSIRWGFTDTASNETGFKAHDEAHAVTATAATANLSYLDETGLVPNTLYTRHIHAYNGAGDSSASTTASRYTLSAAPALTSAKTVSTWYNTPEFYLTSTLSFGTGTVSYYRYAWSQSPTYSFNDGEAQWTTGSLTTIATVAGSWYLHVKSYNAENAGNATTAVYGPYYYETVLPSQATGLSAALSGAATVNLSWNAASDSGGSGLAGYRIERAQDNYSLPGTFSQIGTSATANYSDTTASYNTKYWYRVRGYDNAGNTGAASASVGRHTLSAQPTAPVATDGSLIDRITISWTASTATNHYHVYRDGQSGTGTLVYNGAATSYEDMTTGSHTYYIYAVNNEDVENPSFISDTGFAADTVPAAPTSGAASALSTTSIRWGFTDNAANEVGFSLHDNANTLMAGSATVNLAYLDEVGLAANTQYTRHVHAYNAAGDSTASMDASRYTLPVSPNIMADKTVSTWYNTANVVFTNAAGFGAGSLSYYRYVWDQNPTYAFLDNEMQWTTGMLTKTATAGGSWYLHIKSYNGDNVSGGTANYGPYYYDNAGPMSAALSPANGATGVNPAANLTLTISDSGSGADWTTFSIQLTGSSGYSRTYTDLDTAIVTKTGTAASYNVTVNPDADFGVSETITVAVNVNDALGNPLTPPTWSFTATAELVPSGAIAWWKFNETTGTNAADSAGTNPGTLNGGASWVTGKVGNALSFDGTNDYVNVPHNSVLNPSGDMTIEFWIYFSSLPTAYRDVIQKGIGTSGTFYLIRTTDTGGMQFGMGNTVRRYSSPYYTASDLGFTAGRWQHVSFVVNDASQTAYVYVNGAQKGSMAPVSGSWTAGTAAMTIGGFTWDGYFPGKMDEVVIYNRALSSADVKARYGTRLKSAFASDASNGGVGIQAGDKVVVTFDGPTDGAVIDSSNIATALALSNSHTWGNVTAAWSSAGGNTNDTLTITLPASGSTVAVGDTIILGGVIKDGSGNPISDAMTISGTLDGYLPAGVVAYWKLDEGGATTANDYMGGNTGTINGAGYSWTAGRVQGALSFTGTNGFVNVPHQSSLQPNGDTTIEFWIYFTSLPTAYKEVIQKGIGTPGSFFYARTTDTGGLEIGSSNTVRRYPGAALSSATLGFTAGQWKHVAYVVNDATQTAYIYVNGVQKWSTTALSESRTAGTAALTFGGFTWDGYMNGMMDEVIVYNRALSEAEVLGRFNNP